MSIKILWPKFIQRASCALNLSEKQTTGRRGALTNCLVQWTTMSTKSGEGSQKRIVYFNHCNDCHMTQFEIECRSGGYSVRYFYFLLFCKYICQNPSYRTRDVFISNIISMDKFTFEKSLL